MIFFTLVIDLYILVFLSIKIREKNGVRLYMCAYVYVCVCVVIVLFRRLDLERKEERESWRVVVGLGYYL